MYNSLTKVIYFITLTVVDWVDVFTRPIYKHIVIDSLRYCQENKRLRIYAWVMMSNHLHLLVDVNDEMPYEQERLELSNIIRDFKKFTSKKLVNSIEDNVHESRKDWMMNRFWYAGANDKRIKKQSILARRLLSRGDILGGIFASENQLHPSESCQTRDC